MKNLIERITQVYKELSTELTDSKSLTEINLPKNLTQALGGKTQGQISLILNNILPILNYIQKNDSLLEKRLSTGSAIRIHKTKTKSQFNFQIIQDNGKYLIAISYKRKVTDWFVKGGTKKVKEALVLEVDGENIRWFKAVDLVLRGRDNIKAGILEAEITAAVPTKNVQKIYLGASYTDKNGTEKLSLISEYAQGGDLRSIVWNDKGNDLSFINIFFLCYGITANIHELHQNKITHGDYHIGNIFLYPTESKELKELIFRPVTADLEKAQIKIMAPDEVKKDIEEIGNSMEYVLNSSKLMTEKRYHPSQKPYLEDLKIMMRNVSSSKFKDADSIVNKLNEVVQEMVKNKVESAEILAELVRQHYTQSFLNLPPQPKPTVVATLTTTASYRVPGLGGTTSQSNSSQLTSTLNRLFQMFLPAS